MNTLKVSIRGMHCASCEILIGENIKKVSGVVGVKVDYHRGMAFIHYTNETPSEKAIKQAVRDAGYDVGSKDKLPWISTNQNDYKNLLSAAFILFVIYFIARDFNLFNLNVGTENKGVIVALFVGLVAGVSTCMALVGGLVLSLSARHAELHPEATQFQKFRPHIYFNIGRVLGYGILGGLIGFLGSAFRPSTNLLSFLTMLIGVVMIFFGLKLIEIFPALKNKSITLPSSVARFFGLHKEIKEYSPKSSMIIGALSFFLPCGFTQAMQLYAVSTGSFWQGATIMGLFALGTAPGLLGIGGLTSVFKGHKARVFFVVAGLAVIILGWFNIVNGSRLWSKSPNNNSQINNDQVQEVKMTQNNSGYSPNTFTVEKDKPVKWIIKSTSAFSCAASIVMPKYGISRELKAGENIIQFTPTAVGEIPFSCSMGMYRGKFIVVESKENSSSNSNNTATTNSTEQNGVQVLKSVYTLREDMVPNTFTVKKGQPVRLEIDVRENGRGCMSTVVIPGLFNQIYRLIVGQKIIMEFTPSTVGDYPITCAMGIPHGEINVIN